MQIPQTETLHPNIPMISFSDKLSKAARKMEIKC
jgi:hypothetical protein